jgi:hypothetical protein
MSAVECMSADELRVDETWWRIYGDSFPANEREPPEVILESVLRGVGMAFRTRREGVTVGLATIHLLKDPAAVFLVYLAVARGERNRGAGGELLQGAWESGAARLCAQGLQPLGLLWEVDPPQSAAGDSDVRRRRVAFFQRHGGQLLGRSYLQPPVDGIAAVPMTLMFRPAEGETTPTAETVDALVRALYFDKYGAINKIDRSVLEDLLSRR